MWVWAREGSGTTGRSSSEVALRTPPNDNEAPPEKRRNGGGDVFLGVARDARAGWQQLGGGTEAIAECPQLLAWLF